MISSALIARIRKSLNMKRIVTIVLLVLVAGILAWLAWGRDRSAQSEESNYGSNTPSYVNENYGIGFDFPDGYKRSERVVREPVEHYSITFIRAEDLPAPQGGEGPTSINIDIYSLGSAANLEEWIRTNQASNFAIGPGELNRTTVDGAEALSYTWDGLYPGRTTAFLHNGNVFLVSGTYLAPEDKIVSDYRALVDSIELQ